MEVLILGVILWYIVFASLSCFIRLWVFSGLIRAL